MKFILGEKIDMTQIWQGEECQAVTRVAAGPCTIVQVKSKERDGYAAVQLGFGAKKGKNLSKSVKGHLKDLGNFRHLKEFRLSEKDVANLKVGDTVKADVFVSGDKVTVTGWSKGRGFSGVVKRHGFHGQDATHGNKDQLRMPGSIGAGGVQHVFKGVRMAGRLGNERITAHHLSVVKVDEAAGIVYLNGSVPGARGSLVLLKAEGELKITAPVAQVESEKLQVESKDEKEIEIKEKEEAPASNT